MLVTNKCLKEINDFSKLKKITRRNNMKGHVPGALIVYEGSVYEEDRGRNIYEKFRKTRR